MKKTILITGATSGIGNACVTKFSQNGYDVFATFRNEADGEKLSRIPNVHPLKMDVTNEADIKEAFDYVSKFVGSKGLYAIINNAGITYTAPFEFADGERARKVMEVNVMAPFMITQTFLPLLKRYSAVSETQSRVINIASWAGRLGQPFIPFYNASKAAIIALTESMYYDLGLLGVHAVLASPGITKTPLLEKTTEDGMDNLQSFPEAGRKFYQPYFDHYSTLSAESRNSKAFATPDTIASKLFKIVETEKPKFNYDLAIDAIVVHKILTRFLPFSLIAALNRRTFKLNR